MTPDELRALFVLYEKKVDELLDDGWAANEQIRQVAVDLPLLTELLAGAPSCADPNDALRRAHRLLGFIQGIFYCNKIYTRGELRQHLARP